MSARASSVSEPHFGGDFWKFLTGQTISTLGSSFTTFALPLLIFQLTGSSLNLALTVAASVLPYLFFGLVVGAWVDRVNRKRVMVITDLARALVIASIPLAFVQGFLSVRWIYAAAFLNASLSICFEAANFAAVPSLVRKDDLMAANGWVQGGYSIAKVGGPLLGGLLLIVIPLPKLVLFAKQWFAASDTQVGLLYAAGGLGTVLFALLAGRLRKRWSLGTIALGALITEGVFMALTPATHWYWVLLPLWALRSGADVLFVIAAYSLIQLAVPLRLLGRVITIIRVLTWSPASVGALLGGFAIERTHNVALIYVLIGLLTLGSTFAFFLTPWGIAKDISLNLKQKRMLPEGRTRWASMYEERRKNRAVKRSLQS